jgi:hypothetical protein
VDFSGIGTRFVRLEQMLQPALLDERASPADFAALTLKPAVSLSFSDSR